MAISYSTTIKNTRMTDVANALSNGYLKVGTSGMGTVLATFQFQATAGTVSNGVLTFTLVSTSVTASASGTAASAALYAADGTTLVASGLTVAASGSPDITINSTAIGNGQQVTATGNQTIAHA